MAWSLRSYNLLVNEDGHALRLMGGTWRHPKHIAVVPKRNVDDATKQRILREGMQHVFLNINELEEALLLKLEGKKRAANSLLSPTSSVMH